MNRLIQLAFRDLMMALFALFFLFFLVPHKPEEKVEDTGEVVTQGEVVVEISWPPHNIDIDLWVLSAGTSMPVGYSNKGLRNCNLLRDDLGTSPSLDPLPINFESVVCRKWELGEWVINLHYYGGSDYKLGSMPVDVVVKHIDEKSTYIVYQGTVVLPTVKVERTAVRFIVDGTGKANIIQEPKLFGIGNERGL